MRRLVACLVVSCIVGCGGSASEHSNEVPGLNYGDIVGIKMRPDTLGMASPTPASFVTDSVNGGEVTAYGSYVRQNAGWLVIETEERVSRISKSAIMAVTTVKPRPAPK